MTTHQEVLTPRDSYVDRLTHEIASVVSRHADILGTWTPHYRSGGRISETMVWDFLACVEDGNPAHWNEEWAGAHGGGRLTVPPQMLLTHSRFPPGPIGTAAEWEPDYVKDSAVEDPLQSLLDSLRDQAGLDVCTNAFRRENYLRPIYPGDLLTTSVLIEVSPLKRTRLAHGVFVNTKARHRRVDDPDVLAESENALFVYRAADASLVAMPHDAGPDRRPTARADEEGAITERPPFMSRIAANVKVGQALPFLDFGVDFMDLIRAAQGTRHPVPMHTDRTYAVAAGNRDAYFSTLWQAGVLGRYVTDWSGPKGRLAELTFTMLDNVCPGDHVMIDGFATGINGSDVAVDIVMRTQLGIATKATATVSLPIEPEAQLWC